MRFNESFRENSRSRLSNPFFPGRAQQNSRRRGCREAAAGTRARLRSSVVYVCTRAGVTCLYISNRDAVDNPRAPPSESGRRNYRPSAISHAALPLSARPRGKKCFQRTRRSEEATEEEKGEGRFPIEIKDQCYYRRAIANGRNVQSVCCSCRDTDRERSRGIFAECVHPRLVLECDAKSASYSNFSDTLSSTCYVHN